MELIEGELVVSPTDLTRFLACRHLTRLDVEVARGRRAAPPAAADDALELLFRRGLEHERRFLDRVRAEGRSVVVVDVASHGPGPAGLRAAEAATVEAMASGADVVHQAAFFDGAWRGRAAFLLRRDGRPGRWPWSYDVADTKPARRPALPALLQLSAYADRLAVLQGIPPENLVTVPGDGAPHAVPYAACASAARRLRAAFTGFTASPPETAAVPVPHCGRCRWQTLCRGEWRARDDLTLVAHLPRSQAARLLAAGVGTVAALAEADPQRLATVVPAAVAERVVHQARLQVAERTTGRPAHRLLPAVPGRGLSLLPAPSPGDVFFDMEGDPYAGEHGLEYLFGLVERGRYTAYWALGAAAERHAFESLVDHLMRAWQADPGMHVYHYAPYEPTRLRALAGRFDTRVDDVDRLLRGERLIDLYRVVRQGVQVGKESYSLKRLEDHYWGRGRAGAVADAMGSVIAFERWLLAQDDSALEAIRAYNEDDCRSTQALRDWLEGLRLSGGGDAVFPRPVHGDGAPPARARQRAGRSARVRAALSGRVTDGAGGRGGAEDTGGGGSERDAVALLAALLDWHHREALPEWSEYFRRRGMSEDELIADPVALGGLRVQAELGPVRRSVRWELAFPPQETTLAPGDADWSDPVGGQRLGTAVLVDAAGGRLVVDRAAGREPPPVTALVPPGPVRADELAARLAELAEWVAEHGVDAPLPHWRAARDLLRRRPAGSPLRRPEESAGEAVLRLTAGARGAPAVLAVQGPPGTGKTYVAARVILQAVEAGRTVGVCAFSHAAVGELLGEAIALARTRGLRLPVLQKAGRGQACRDPAVRRTSSTTVIEAALEDGRVRLVAGTAWLFAAPGMRDRLDLLVVDEAGQLSLANVVAVSGCARSLVLFGDPRQLTQPVRGAHPPGAGGSALEHLLGDHATIPADRGILLDETYRMHPRIAEFVSARAYDGRVRVAAGRDRQRIESAGPLAGSGLRWVPVPGPGPAGHGMSAGPVPAREVPADRAFADDAAAASAQARVVAELVRSVLADGRHVDADGRRHPLHPADVLVLTPTNRQAHRVRRALEAVSGSEGVRVGTVDVNQGGQAPLVIYNLAGTGMRTERGLDFLLDPRRLTVALSRACALAAVVADPALLLAEVGTSEQLLRLGDVSAFVDAAATVVTAPPSEPQAICGGECHPGVAAADPARPLPSGHGQLQPPAPA